MSKTYNGTLDLGLTEKEVAEEMQRTGWLSSHFNNATSRKAPTVLDRLSQVISKGKRDSRNLASIIAEYRIPHDTGLDEVIVSSTLARVDDVLHMEKHHRRNGTE